MKLAFALFACLCILGTSTLARADDPRAEALLERGASLRERGRVEAALQEFVHANSIESTPRSLAQIGLTHGQLQHWVEAYEFLRDAMRSESNPWIRSRWRNLESAMLEVRRHIGFVRINGTGENVRLVIATRDVGSLPFSESVAVLPGAITLEFRRGSAILFSREATVGLAETVDVDVSGEPLLAPPRVDPAPQPVVRTPEPAPNTPSEPATRARALPTVGWILVGAGAVGIVTGAVFHLMRESEAGAANECRLMSDACVGTADEHVRAADRDQALAITGYAVGALLVAGGITMLVLSSDDDASDSSLACAPVVGPISGASCSGHF